MMMSELEKESSYFTRELDIFRSATMSSAASPKQEALCVIIHQLSKGTVGAVVWDSALVACKYFEKLNLQSPNYFRDMKILELGAGTGVCSIVLAAFGADVVATDLQCQLDLIELNISTNKAMMSKCPVVELLDWSQMDTMEKFSTVTFDMILMSVYPLLGALTLLATPKTEILCIYEMRDVGKPKDAQENFFQLAKEHFVCERIPHSQLHPEYISEDIPVMRLQKQ